jgi:hypothetical protein
MRLHSYATRDKQGRNRCVTLATQDDISQASCTPAKVHQQRQIIIKIITQLSPGTAMPPTSATTPDLVLEQVPEVAKQLGTVLYLAQEPDRAMKLNISSGSTIATIPSRGNRPQACAGVVIMRLINNYWYNPARETKLKCATAEVGCPTRIISYKKIELDCISCAMLGHTHGHRITQDATAAEHKLQQRYISSVHLTHSSHTHQRGVEQPQEE